MQYTSRPPHMYLTDAPGAEPFFEIETDVGHTPAQGVARVSACTYFPTPYYYVWSRSGVARGDRDETVCEGPSDSAEIE
jgi:hypothetical protein